MTFHPPDGWEDPSGLPAPAGPGPAWWHDDRGWDDGDGWGAFPRRRPGRVIRFTGLVVAAALVLGSAGTALEVVFGHRPPTSLPTTAVRLAAAGPGRQGGAGDGRVTFVVRNPGTGPVTPTCRVVVFRGARQLGRTVVAGGRPLGQGAAEHGVVSVPAVGPVGDGARARVACWA